MLRQLSRLSSLTKLELTNVKINLDTLDRIGPFPNVRSLTLNKISRVKDGTELSIVSDLFPNLQKLTLGFDSGVRT